MWYRFKASDIYTSVSINHHNSLRIKKDDAVQLETVLMCNYTVAVNCECNTYIYTNMCKSAFTWAWSVM